MVICALAGKSYANAVYKMAPAASPTAAPVSAGGPVPLSTILYSSVPTVSFHLKDLQDVLHRELWNYSKEPTTVCCICISIRLRKSSATHH